MKKRDIVVGLIIGFLIGILALATFKNLEPELRAKFEWFSIKLIYPFPIIIPILIVFGLFIAKILSKKIKVVWQLAKFVVVGALNTFVDLGILNLLIFVSKIDTRAGILYGLFKFISFSCAATNSYFWNKSWTFEKGSQVKGKEFAGFYFVTGIGALINVGVAVFLVKVIGPQFDIAQNLWAGAVAPFIGVLCGFVWNFLAYKFFIFKK
jgi:putative flippase GtrA